MSNQPFRITAPYDVLLRGSKEVPYGIFQLQTTTAEQLTRLHYGRKTQRPHAGIYTMTSIKYVMALLKVLTDHQVIQRDHYPIKDKQGMYHNVSCYTLDNRGMAHLRRLRIDTDDAWRAAKEGDKSGPWIEHILEVNDVVISAALLPRVTSDFWLDHFEPERTFRRKPYKPSWQQNGVTYTATIIPDAFLVFGHGTRRLPVLLEHDRDTEKETAFRRKIRGYTYLLKTGSDTALYGTHGVTVAFTVFGNPHRLDEMRRWTREELKHDPPEVTSAFCFACLDAPPEPSCWLSPIWHTAFEQNVPEPLLAA